MKSNPQRYRYHMPLSIFICTSGLVMLSCIININIFLNAKNINTKSIDFIATIAYIAKTIVVIILVFMSVFLHNIHRTRDTKRCIVVGQIIAYIDIIFIIALPIFATSSVNWIEKSSMNLLYWLTIMLIPMVPIIVDSIVAMRKNYQ